MVITFLVTGFEYLMHDITQTQGHIYNQSSYVLAHTNKRVHALRYIPTQTHPNTHIYTEDLEYDSITISARGKVVEGDSEGFTAEGEKNQRTYSDETAGTCQVKKLQVILKK